VFFIQCAIAATNVVAAVLLTRQATAEQTSAALVLAYLSAYVVGSALSYAALRATLGGLESPVLVRFLVRMVLVVGITAAAAAGLNEVLGAWDDGDSKLAALLRLGAVGGTAGVLYLLLAKAFRVREVTGVLDMLTRRLRRA
jgi:putative peptidoglycan lipid II flippase